MIGKLGCISRAIISACEFEYSRCCFGFFFCKDLSSALAYPKKSKKIMIWHVFSASHCVTFYSHTFCSRCDKRISVWLKRRKWAAATVITNSTSCASHRTIARQHGGRRIYDPCQFCLSICICIYYMHTWLLYMRI